MGRFAEELEQIAIVNSMKGRKGQQYAARQDAIKITLERENREYTTTGLGKCLNYDGSTFSALSDTQI